jgi:hypothetical protein
MVDIDVTLQEPNNDENSAGNALAEIFTLSYNAVAVNQLDPLN